MKRANPLDQLVDQLEAKGFRLSIDRIRESGEWHASAWSRDAMTWSNWSSPRFRSGPKTARKGVGLTMDAAVTDLLAKLGDTKAGC